MDKRIENAVSLLDEETKKDHSDCLKKGYKDEFCPKCDRLFLAHHHFVRCDAKPCPMSNGMSLIDMMLADKEPQPEHINDITDPVNPEPQMSWE